MLIHDYLEYYARNTPDLACLTQGDLHLSYSDLDQHANQLANALLGLGIGIGQRVAILGENSPEHFQLFMAASKVGAVAVPLNYRLAPAELAFIINDAQVSCVIVLDGMQSLIAQLKPLLGPNVRLFAEKMPECNPLREWISQCPSDKPDDSLVEEQGEYMQLYTSGTTGNPKGVVISHRNVLALMTMNTTAYPHRQTIGSSCIICAPLFHIGGAGSVFSSIFTGIHTLLHKSFDPNAVLDDIEAHPVRGLFMVPAMIGAILQAPGAEARDYSDLQQIFYGASPISETLLRRALKIMRCDFVQMYGMTETTGTVINLSAEDHRAALAGRPELLRSAGRPSVGAQAKVISANGERMPTGEVGEICVKSDTNMLGYFNLPEETAKTLNDGWVSTGDAGYIDEDGYVYLKDRIKDMVVSGAENIYPVEVENTLAKHPAIIDVAVIGVPDQKFGEALLAFVVLKEGSDLNCDQMIEFCRSKIAGYKIPRQLEFINELPRNPSGKILKKELRAPYWQGHSRNVG